MLLMIYFQADARRFEATAFDAALLKIPPGHFATPPVTADIFQLLQLT